MMRLLLLFLLPLTLSAVEPAPLLIKPAAALSTPTLKEPLGPEWSVAKGKWEPSEGLLNVTDLPEEKHVPVLHLATGPGSLRMECDFRFHGAGKIFYIGCDGAKHIGRFIVTPKSARLAEDSTEVKGVTPSHTLAESAVDVKPDEWQHAQVEFTGDRMAARLNETELRAQHPYLATPKVRWWFAAGDGVQLRNIRVTRGEPLPDQP